MSSTRRIRHNIAYITGTGGGGGAPASTGPDQHHIIREQIGPSSYATGGFEVDLSAFLTSINYADLVVKKGARGVLPAVDVLPQLNSSSAGKVKFKLMRRRYNRVSSVGNVQGQPAGVTVQASSGVASSSESSHTHAIDHNHASFASAAASTGAGQVLLDVLGPSLATHTHTLDLPNLTGTSGAGTAHNHTDNSIYQHQHAITQVATNLANVEIANATDLSATTFYLLVTGVSV